jgi:hypothetical protein
MGPAFQRKYLLVSDSLEISANQNVFDHGCLSLSLGYGGSSLTKNAFRSGTFLVGVPLQVRFCVERFHAIYSQDLADFKGSNDLHASR